MIGQRHIPEERCNFLRLSVSNQSSIKPDLKFTRRQSHNNSTRSNYYQNLSNSHSKKAIQKLIEFQINEENTRRSFMSTNGDKEIQGPISDRIHKNKYNRVKRKPLNSHAVYKRSHI